MEDDSPNNGSDVELSEAPATLREFMSTVQAREDISRVSSSELPLPRALKAVAERMEERTKDPEVLGRADVLMRIVHAEHAQRLIDPTLHTTDSALKTVEELKRQRDIAHYQALVFREFLKELPKEKREELLTTAYFLHSLPDLLDDPRNVGGAIETLGMLIQFLENHSPDDGENEAIKTAYPHLFIEYISILKYLDFKIQDENYSFNEKKARTHIVMRKAILRELLPEITDEEQRRKTEEVLDSLDEINESDVRALIKEYVEAMSALPVFNLVEHYKSSKKNSDIIENIPARLKVWQKGLQSALDDNDPIYLDSSNKAVADDIKVLADNYEFLGRSLNDRFIKLIPKEIPAELRDLLKGIVKYAANMLIVLERIEQKNEGEGAEARFGSELAPVFAQLKMNYESLLRKFNKAADKVDDSKLDIESLEFDSSSEIKPHDIVMAEIDRGPDRAEDQPTATEAVQLFDADEIDAVLEVPTQEDLLPGRVSFFLTESCMRLGQALNEDIGRYITLATQDKYNGELGPELKKCIKVLKRTLRRTIVTMAKIFNDDIYMTDIFPEMKDEIKSHRTLRAKVLDFNEDMQIEMAGFDVEFKKLGDPEAEVNLAIVLTYFQNLSELMDKHDCLAALFLEDGSINWEDEKKSLNDFVEDPANHKRFLIRAMTQDVSDFLNSINGTLPTTINNRELLMVNDKDRIQRAGLKISTAKALLVAEQSDEDLLALLTSAGGDLLGCRDRDREVIDGFMKEIEDVIEFIEKLDEQDRHLLNSMFIQLETGNNALLTMLKL